MGEGELTVFLPGHKIYPFQNATPLTLKIKKTDNTVGDELIIIGPEGGLSEEEEDVLFSKKNVNVIHLDLPIMRAPTALCTCFGVVYSLINK